MWTAFFLLGNPSKFESALVILCDSSLKALSLKLSSMFSLVHATANMSSSSHPSTPHGDNSQSNMLFSFPRQFTASKTKKGSFLDGFLNTPEGSFVPWKNLFNIYFFGIYLHLLFGILAFYKLCWQPSSLFLHCIWVPCSLLCQWLDNQCPHHW